MNNRLGVLLAISSLPSHHGIGDFGENAIKFIDFLRTHHFHYWQVLPLNPIGLGNSPYMSCCSKAFDYRYVNLDELTNEGLLGHIKPFMSKSTYVDFKKVGEFKLYYLKKAYDNYLKGNTEGLRKFKSRQPWVYQYATFEVFSKLCGTPNWSKWDIEKRDYFCHHNNPPKRYLYEINFEIFIQYMAYKQYRKLLCYANRKNIKIICDMPFYVAFESVETWLNRNMFSIDKDNNLLEVAGVGPDAFSKTGQLWGMPIYNFENMKTDHYSLLIDRISYLSHNCNILRLDHFRAFDTYYVIKNGEVDACNGVWKLGPSYDFFDTLFSKEPNISLIAEDLGLLREEVYTLKNHYHLPGMYVIQFAIFDKDFKPDDNTIVYSGTHDNQTLKSFVNSLSKMELKEIKKILNVTHKKEVYLALLKHVASLPSKITIFPLSDLLLLDDRYRMNEPSTLNDKNWTIRYKDFSFINKLWLNKKRSH